MYDLSLAPAVIRFLFGGGAVVASTLLARAFGGRVGGIFAAFPAVYLAAIISLALDYHGDKLMEVSIQISQGALVGMVANIICALCASYFIYKRGWSRGLILALLVWSVASVGIYLLWKSVI
ncbi:DUF3147 family protein [Syntrophomonas erecta]